MKGEPVPRWLSWRRAFDAALAVVLLVVSLPVVVVLAAAVRATSPGSPIIRLPRMGRHGRQFGMWKLRSMRTPTAAGPGAGLTPSGDSRVTDVGRFLRRTHLDEIPQLLNVVRGHMALVGARPESPEYVDLADPRWTAVLRARPGIVGPTQFMVHRHEAEFLSWAGEDGYRSELLPVKLAIDEWYVRQASPRLDAAVVLAVVQELALRRHPAGLLRLVRREVPETARLPLARR